MFTVQVNLLFEQLQVQNTYLMQYRQYKVWIMKGRKTKQSASFLELFVVKDIFMPFLFMKNIYFK